MVVSGSTEESTTNTDGFTYDGAGRMTARTVDGAVSTLTWDPMSNLVATEGPASVGGSRVYVYDASGQRVAQLQVTELSTQATPVAVSVYVGDVQVDDADATLTGHVTGTRYVSSGGATVATVTVTDGGAPQWSLMFGDVQGSAQVVMGLNVDPAQASGFAAASASDGIQRTAYTPYGARRGTEDLDIDRGWLGQVEDTDIGLTYLNARYYDPVLSRFLSPDPLMNPGDPRTLDAYRYAENNPVHYTDSSGLMRLGAFDCGASYSCASTSADAIVQAKNAGGGSSSGGSSGVSGSGGSSGGGGVSGKGFGETVPAIPAGGVKEDQFTFSPGGAFAWGPEIKPWDPGSGNGISCDTTIECWVDQFKQFSEGSREVLKELGIDPKDLELLRGDVSLRRAVAILSHMEQLGPLLSAVGLAASAVDSYWRIGDMGWDDDLNPAEKTVFVTARVAAGEVGGAVGTWIGVGEGAAGGLICGEGAIACSPIAALGVGAVSGMVGDAVGTWAFDRAADMVIPAYIEWKWWD